MFWLRPAQTRRAGKSAAPGFLPASSSAVKPKAVWFSNGWRWRIRSPFALKPQPMVLPAHGIPDRGGSPLPRGHGEQTSFTPPPGGANSQTMHHNEGDTSLPAKKADLSDWLGLAGASGFTGVRSEGVKGEVPGVAPGTEAGSEDHSVSRMSQGIQNRSVPYRIVSRPFLLGRRGQPSPNTAVSSCSCSCWWVREEPVAGLAERGRLIRSKGCRFRNLSPKRIRR